MKEKKKKNAQNEYEEEVGAPAERDADSWLAKNKYGVISFGLGVLAVLTLVLFIASWAGSSAWFTIFPRFLEGLFSFASFGTPFILLYCAYFLVKIKNVKKYKWNVILSVTLMLTVSIMAGLILNKGVVTAPFGSNGAPGEYQLGRSIEGGGLFGAYVSWLFTKALTAVGAWILTVALAVVQVIFLIDFSMSDAGAFFGGLAKKLGRKIKNAFAALWRKITKKEKKPASDNKPAPEDDDEFVPPETPDGNVKYYNKPVIDENPYAEDERKSAKVPVNRGGAPAQQESGYTGITKPEVIERPAPEGWGETKSAPEKKTVKAEKTAGGSVNLEEIFGNGESIVPKDSSPAVLPIDDETGGKAEGKKSVARMAIAAKEEEAEERYYTFPPVKLLTPAPPQQESVSDEELQANGARLVETLRSFKVRTQIVNISHGPTITRYELLPDEGVRVRQIASLVDDISLQLASSGVRIEAPIPGVSAVGVEVPNKVRETVYLRTLIDDRRFEQSQAKLTAAVGVDVGGKPVYVDLAKMPHLLIAGTTGSGKSVCLNCLILSILYKATPDEVKMIMIDPKKVEFSVYNGLPHLIIPVVSNSKKAAGALAWAATEMDRRYEMIEQVNVRNIYSYNKVTADDPDKEHMPQLVIIIDELADLMLTAPGDVEENICRIAAKGRAAGIHLIIGTQRPSVDVITGLIKANVPSRIAFTVSSQVDSRTIIDIAGAEKLIGRGDMLFYPTGYTKPVRLQGAFVSDNEVEEITKFVIDHSSEAIYDDKVMHDIEKEAELCGTKGKKQTADADISAGDDGEEDPMLRSAIDLAVESGKISTSLIQRRLSLGYGRAAKLIDEMEKRGIVSPPEGQKPRTVLITPSEWNEIRMRSEE
ncbi:MAG: DNA translocase FtsK [Clostridia bacterium]|nr:DNA translocase FtsK [Clostridia bacterium]